MSQVPANNIHDDATDVDDPDESASAPVSFGVNAEAAAPLIMAAAAIGAALSGTEATGNPIADFLLPAGFAAAVVWLARSASPAALLLAPALALAFSGLQLPAVVLAGLGLVAALAVTSWRQFDADSRSIVGGVVGALVVLAVLRLPSFGFFASASLTAAVAVAPMIIAGFLGLGDQQKPFAKRALVGLSIAVVLATALTGLAALWARGAVLNGIDQAEDGIDALLAGDQVGAKVLLEDAEDNFGAAAGRLGGPLAWPSRFVPIVAQHSRALEVAATQGETLASTAVRTVTTADVEAIRGNNGAIDLELVQEVNAELTNANMVLRDAQRSLNEVRSPWLVGLLDTRLGDVDAELVDVVADIDLANHATAVVPGLLGANGPRQYLVLFIQPSEAREFGGLAAAYGLLKADGGQLELLESGAFNDDIGDGDAQFSDPTQFTEAYYFQLPQVHPQNVTGTPDLATIARALDDLLPQWRLDPDFSIDGVITIDPFALAGMLELTGPITLEGRADPIAADNVADYLLRDQYLEFDDDDREIRQDALNELAARAFAELLSIEVPGPERLGEIFGPLARGDRIAMTTFDDAENAFFSRVLLDANMPIVAENIEMLGVYTQTGVAGKLDAYAHRDMHYVVDVDPATGEASGTLQLTLRNDAPANAGTYVLGDQVQSGIDPDRSLPLGDNLMGIFIYGRTNLSNYRSPTETPFDPYDPLDALTYQRGGTRAEIPLGGVAEIALDVSGHLASPGRYDLLVTAQQVANIGEITVTVRPAAGWRVIDPATSSPETQNVAVVGTVADDGSWAARASLDHHQVFSVEFERSSTD